jgi:hypothetical protein
VDTTFCGKSISRDTSAKRKLITTDRLFGADGGTPRGQLQVTESKQIFLTKPAAFVLSICTRVDGRFFSVAVSVSPQHRFRGRQCWSSAERWLALNILFLSEAVLPPSFCQIAMAPYSINRADSGGRCTPKVHLSAIGIPKTMLTLPIWMPNAEYTG